MIEFFVSYHSQIYFQIKLILIMYNYARQVIILISCLITISRYSTGYFLFTPTGQPVFLSHMKQVLIMFCHQIPNISYIDRQFVSCNDIDKMENFKLKYLANVMTSNCLIVKVHRKVPSPC